MSTDKHQRFNVIVNEELVQKDEKQASRGVYFQTNPLKEKLVKHVNEETEKKFSVKDLLKW